MKKTATKSLAIILSILCIVCVVSCNKADATGLWGNATYLADTQLGNGQKTVSFEVEAGDKKISITINTDKATLGEAMYEHNLINDPTFFNTLNGILADWDKNNAYWAFYQGEDLMLVGVNETAIAGGEHFRFVYTK